MIQLIIRVARKLARIAGLRTYAVEEDWLDDFASKNRSVFFIQIGAHDGKTDDKLHDVIQGCGWSGVLVEPVPYLFKRLLANYAGNPRLKFENSVLAGNGETIFYRLPETDGLPSYYDQIGSMNRDVILKHPIANEQKLIEEKLPSISFETLLQKHGVSKVDLILIDTEGSDLDVLRQIDFTRYRPQMVIYEHKHLSPSNESAAVELLTSRGYQVFACGPNSVAVPGACATWRKKLLSFPR